MNFLDLIGEKILDCVLAALGRNVDYLIHYKSNVDNLIPQVIYLLDAKDSIQNEVAAARRNVMEIHPHVQTWLTCSDGIIAEAEKFIKNNGHSKMTCCSGWCPNLISRYRVSKRAYKMRLEVEEIKGKGNFNGVGYHEPTQVVGTATSNTGYEAFESRRSILTGVLEALKDPNINRIGVYGMGGVGKTMLAKEVVEQAHIEKLFDKYVFVVVSQDPDLKKVQREIMEQLDLERDVESVTVRAALLHKRLLQEKILIVIDDIWKPLELKALGIPFGDDQKGCKLLLTSRYHDVLYNGMDTKHLFLVGVLSEDEAMNLFEKIVGDLAKTPEIQPNMLEIVKECSGLPIAITTVANTLKNEKDKHVWEDAVNLLKMSDSIKIDEMDEKVYKSIKWSYEFLKSNEAKSLWLLCGLHREDYNIKVEDLLKYGVGLSLFGNLDKIEDARHRVHTLVKKLKDSSLLLEGDYNGTVKMHDVIRDVAINIAAEERQMFMIRNTTDLQECLNCKDSCAISLPHIDICDFPRRFECPKLHLFFMFDEEETLQIPISFFEGLKELRVLSISQIWFSRISFEIPPSLLVLEKLQTLCVVGDVEDVTIIGELKNLKILSLSLKYFEQLPKEIGHLTHLQLLDLEKCDKLKVIPPNVLSNMKILQELYLPSTVEWEVEEQSTERSNAMVSELDNLSHLVTLHIHIKNSKILPKAMVFERLVSYRIVIGSDLFWNKMLEGSRILKLNLSFQSDDGYKVLLRECESLFLREMKGVKNILYELDSEGFQRLKHLTVQHNDEIQYIIKSMGVLGSVFPILESINLSNMINLEWICYTRLPAESFRNLRVVKVRKCRNLKFVFSSSMVGCFSHLQEMEIDDCEKMSEIIAIERKEEIEVNSDDNIMFPQLRSLTMSKLLKLKAFFSDDEYLVLNRKVVFPNLEGLKIEGMDSMKMIWPDQLILDSFCKLENLTVSNFINLTNILPPNMLRTLQNLKCLNIDSCGSIEEVFEIQRTNNVEETHDIAAAELRSLKLVNLGKLKHVWSMDPQGIITFGKLNTVNIHRCSSLKSVFPTSVAKALMQLEELKIRDCATVEEIIAKEEGIETTTLFVFPRLFSLILVSLPELKSFYPGKYTSEWPLLNQLTIHNCDKLKIFGSNKESVEETNGLDHDVSVIQQRFFFSEKDKFPNLEDLSLDEGDAMNETCGGPSAEFCCNLKYLRLYRNGKIPNVETPIARVGVSDFRRLKNFVPFSSKSFRYLQILYVYRSDVLISLLTPSTAKTLMQLQIINIGNCERMTEIVANKGSEAEAGDEIAFNNLKSLHLHSMPSLTAFHLGNRTIKFPSLDHVRVEDCRKLINLLTPSTARTLVQLERVDIENCKRMTEIIANEGSEAEAGDEITFNNLKSLYLIKLPSLTAFHLGNRTIKFPSLDHVRVEDCHKLISLLTPSTARTLVQLETVDIENCERMTEIVANEGSEAEAGDEITFNNLKSLYLIKLPSLTAFHSGNRTIKFPSLDHVRVEDCRKLISLLTPSTARTLVQLEKVHIENCKRMTEIVANEGSEAEAGDEITFNNLKSLYLIKLPSLTAFHLGNRTIKFPSLDHVRVEDCHKLISLVTPSTARTLVQLETVDIENCKRMTEIVANEGSEAEAGDEITFNNLKSLYLIKLPSLTAFHLGNRTIKFPSLDHVRVEDCHKLISLLTPSTARTLVQLETVDIENCERMTEIVANEGSEAEAGDEITFNNLKSLYLIKLPSLTAFHSGNRTIKFPSLDHVRVEDCRKLISLLTPSTARTLVQLEKVHIENCKRMTEIVANEGSEAEAGDEITFNNLKSLYLIKLPSLTAFHLGNRTIKFPSLDHVRVEDCHKLISLVTPSTARTLVQLETVDIENCKRMTEIVANEGSEAEAGDEITFNNLKSLYLIKLPSLTAFHLGNRTIKFPSLDHVRVEDCRKLISLLTPSTARTLVQLERVDIENCKRMTEIIANEGSEAEAGDEIAFNNLEYLEFINLPSLIAFHLGNRTIKFPSLDHVRVEDCPKLKIFCSGVLSTPKLKEVWMGEKRILKEEGDGDVDLNATIKEYWEAKLETCDQKFAKKTDASDGEESEHDTNDDLERETTSDGE